MRKCFRFSNLKLKEKSEYRSNLAKQLRKVYCNLYGIEFLNGVPESFEKSGYEYLFIMFEKGYLNEIQFIRALQVASLEFNR